MVLQLFIITQDEITEVSPAHKLSPQDVGLVYHEESHNLYVFKGEDSLVLDEFQSEILYDRILNRFLNTNIYFLQSLIPTSENSPATGTFPSKYLLVKTTTRLMKLPKMATNSLLFLA